MQNTSATMFPPFFPAFRQLAIEAGGVPFAGVIGGEGPPVLLLHGYPQTYVAWRRIAPTLAEHHTVVIPDLPGYGASLLRDMASRWTKRRVGEALAALLSHLGHDRFSIVGHDRGARRIPPGARPPETGHGLCVAHGHTDSRRHDGGRLSRHGSGLPLVPICPGGRPSRAPARGRSRRFHR